MKKIVIAVALVCALALCAVACSKKEEVQPQLLGGWTLADSPVVTAQAQGLMDKALKGFTGANYVPVAYVGSQVVAGTNHLLLCRANQVIPGAQETWALVTLYEDLDGNVTIKDVQNSGAQTWLMDLMGGWYLADSPEVTAEVQAACAKALEGWTGSVIEPVALVSTQVVSGTNYLLLAKVTPVEVGAQGELALVTMYVDLQGAATFTDMVPFSQEQ